MKLTIKQRSKLATQVRKVTALENYMIANVAPVDCPVKHHFAEKIVCREFFMPAGTVLTGTLYKIDCFWVMVKGKMKMAEGNGSKIVEAPALLKNVVGQKNALYALEDCLFYGFIPNPDNSTNIEDIINITSAIDANELMGMPNNKQQLNFEERTKCA